MVLNSGEKHTLGKTDLNYSKFEIMAGAGAEKQFSTEDNCFDTLKTFRKENQEWMFGHLSYDLKNEIEPLLYSQKANHIGFDQMSFFVPTIRIEYAKDKFIITSNDGSTHPQIFRDICKGRVSALKKSKFSFQTGVNKEDYYSTLKQLKHHIQVGDIYEVTYCRELFAETEIIPEHQYLNLMEVSPAPFSALYRHGDKYLISASPERFLARRGRTIISQPIKGTYPRFKDAQRDEESARALLLDEKERAENVMIVDLVRNDLSRTALMDSVKVKELFGIYSFPGVHQMISTVTSDVDPRFCSEDVIKYAFPMGSMTGAPKVRAMQIIEEYEKSYRGLFSGSVGYFSPDGDFDFSVIIRSLLYNQTNRYLSLSVGGAITSKSDIEKEFQETEMKAERIQELFS